MSNKPIHIVRSSMPPFEKYIEKIRPLWDSCWLTNMGVLHNELEERIAKYLEVPYTQLFANGHLALEAAIQALDLKGEVITTPFTFASTTHAIVRANLVPVFCDIDPITYNIDPKKIESLITPRTSAILAVHVYGTPCNVKEIQEIADRYNLKVVYDSAHAFGVKLDGLGIGNFGDISMFSFHGTKVFHTVEGGGLSFRDEKLIHRLKSIKNFGLAPQGVISEIGTNAKMSEFHAAMGLCNLDILDGEIFKRKLVVERYYENFEKLEGIQLLPRYSNVDSNYMYFPILLTDEFRKNRERVTQELSNNYIYARKYFYPLTSKFDCYKNKFINSYTPIAEYVSERILALPLYADLALDDVDRICAIIKG